MRFYSSVHSLSKSIMVIMSQLFYYFAFIFIAIVSCDEVDESCRNMFTPEFLEEDCCDTVYDSIEDTDADYEGCKIDDSDDSDEAKCEAMKCYLKNIGILESDKINNEAAKKRLKNMESKYPKNKNVTKRISKQCLDDKYLKYGTDEMCVAMKYFICSYVNTVLECDSWKNTEQCSKNSEYAKKCKDLFD